MAVSSVDTLTGPYTTNGVTTTFPFTFKAMAGGEVRVFRVADNGNQAVINPGSYDVVLGDDGGSVIFSSAPIAGDPLYVGGNPDFTQQITFENQGAFLPEVMNEAFDRAAVRDLSLKSDVDRAIQVPFGEVGLALPTAGERAAKVLAFDIGGGAVPLAVDFASAPITDDGPWSPDDPLAGGDGGALEFFSNERLDLGKFGIVDSESMDQTAAMLRVAAYVNLLPSGAAIFWGNRTVKITAQVEFTTSVSIMGGGLGCSKLICDGTNAGIVASYGSGADNDYTGKTFMMKDMRVMTVGQAVVTPVVVDVDSDTGGVAVGATIRDCQFSGVDEDSGFPYAVELVGCSNIKLDNIIITGARGVLPLPGLGGIYVGTKEAQAKADLHADRLLVTFVRTALKIRGRFEGVKVTNSTTVAVVDAIDWAADATEVEPLLYAAGNHLNAERRGILLDGIVQYQIFGNLLYNQAAEAVATEYVGIDTKVKNGQPLMSCIIGNQFFLLDGTAATRSAIGIRGQSGSPTALANVIVECNTVRGGGAGTVVGVYLDPYTVGAIIGMLNDFRACTTDIVDESGTNTVHHSTSAGNIGIRKINPTSPLHVGGDIRTDGVFIMPGGIVVAQGAATPEGSFAAPPASLYLTPGATYRKATGTGNTGWVSLG